MAHDRRVYIANHCPISELNAVIEWCRKKGFEVELQSTSSLRPELQTFLDCQHLILASGWEANPVSLEIRAMAQKMGIAIWYWNSIAQDCEVSRIIGISGLARSGKDTVANILTNNFGFQRLAFADPMRAALYGANPLVLAELSEPNGYLYPSRLQRVVDYYGWEHAKSSGEIRSLLQRFGTEGVRNQWGEDFWVDMLFSTPHGPRLVIPDVRFPNEVKRIRSLGGSVWRVNRDGVEAPNNHSSESSLDDSCFDAIINNNYGLKELHQSIDFIMGGF